VDDSEGPAQQYKREHLGEKVTALVAVPISVRTVGQAPEVMHELLCRFVHVDERDGGGSRYGQSAVHNSEPLDLAPSKVYWFLNSVTPFEYMKA
jgi:hypothetical protein